MIPSPARVVNEAHAATERSHGEDEMIRTATTAAGLALLAGCTLVGAYDPSYFAPWRIDPVKKIEGRALVLTAAEDDAFVYSERPTTFIGSAFTLRLPLGVLAREAALRVFGDLFRGGAAASNDPSNAAGHRAVISPHVTRFTHTYYWTRAIVSMSVSVRLLDARDVVLFEKSYDAGPVEVETMDGPPAAERFTRTTQVTLQGLMLRAAADVKAQLDPPASSHE